ncbi:stage VI sporulation protein D (LysM domain) [Anoxybacillus flavithermus]|nr:stage VI sporulation protein D (LysM domain) [Anoxybacillus flavithermus]
MLRFSIEEAIAFRREHHVDQLLSISLQPTITIEEQEDYVYIRGVLELSGEYTKGEEDGEDNQPFEAARYVEHVRITDEQIGEFLHQFPIDVTVPKERIDDLEQVYVMIESFDYDFKQQQLRLIAEVAIHGIQMDDREDDEWEPYNVDEFEPFETVARQEVYQQEEAEEEQESIVNVPPFYMFHEENDQVEEQHEVERAEERKEEQQSFQLEMKGRDTNEKRNENALYLTKLFGKNEEQAFARLKICIVQQGDSLDKIAERYDVSVQQLLRTNHLESGVDIHEGQLLYIPTPTKV